MDEEALNRACQLFMYRKVRRGRASGKEDAQIGKEVSSSLRKQFQVALKFETTFSEAQLMGDSSSDRPRIAPKEKKNNTRPRRVRCKPSKITKYSTDHSARLIGNEERDLFQSLGDINLPLTAEEKELINSQKALDENLMFKTLKGGWETTNRVVRIAFLRWLAMEWGIITETDIDIFERRHD